MKINLKALNNYCMKEKFKLKILKLIVQGQSYQRTLEFSDKLNIISGEKTSGKSLVLSLIDYCLGKEKISLKVQTELAENVDSIFLEININNEIFTIRRGLKKNITNFFIYYCQFSMIEDFIPEKMNKKELQFYLMQKLGAFEFKKTKNKTRSNELTTETVSFRDIFRYCFINQHELGTHNFLSNNDQMKRYKNPISFEMMFDLIDFSQNDVQSKIVEVQNVIINNEKKKDNLVGYLEQRDNDSYFELLEQINDYNNQIAEMLERKTTLINKQNKENEISKSNSDFVLLNTEIRDLDLKISLLNKKKRDIELGIRSNELLLNDYKSELRDIKTTEEINYRLRIDDHELTCPLCSSKIANTFSDNNREIQVKENYSTITKDIKNKIDMVNEIISTSSEKIKEISLEVSRKNRKKEILILALNEFAKDVHTPFLPELNSINISVNNLEKDREVLLESKRVHRKIEELNKEIESDKMHLKTLKLKLKTISDNKIKKETIMNELNKNYLKNMKQMKYKDLSDTYIDGDNYLPYYRGASVYEHDSGGLLECMQLAYLDSIISSPFVKYHPNLLMLDSISKYFGTNKSDHETSEKDIINDPEVYLNIYYMLVQLSEKAQIIIVENTPLDEMSKYEKYSFRNGDKGFINIDLNEFLSN